ERTAHVAVDRDDLLAQELLEALAVRAPQRAERLARGDVAPEARRRALARLRSHDEIDPLDVGVPVEQHRPEHLPEKAGPAEDHEARAPEDARDVERRRGVRGVDA